MSPSAAAHIVSILRFHSLSRSYCPLFKFTLISFCAQLLLQFLWDFYMKLSQNDGHQMLQRILSGFCDSIFYQGVIALVLNLHFWASLSLSLSLSLWTRLKKPRGIWLSLTAFVSLEFISASIVYSLKKTAWPFPNKMWQTSASRGCNQWLTFPTTGWYKPETICEVSQMYLFSSGHLAGKNFMLRRFSVIYFHPNQLIIIGLINKAR